jgi:L-ascorbate metabolism protein UlaG (beta-lactamase superfamily)
MKQVKRFAALALGQVGYRFQFERTVMYIDPYLTDYVEEFAGSDHRRLFPTPLTPEAVTDADWVLLTHVHIDHCDPRTVVAIADASPMSRFVGPAPVLDVLRQQGISEARMQLASEVAWLKLDDVLQVMAVPGSHPSIERDHNGRAHYVGYVVEYYGRRIYHAGDTSIADELMQRLMELAPIDIAFLPVNERNYFRERRGIIGNMTLREAFGLADEIGVKLLVPTHWDMFAPNSVPREEIELLHALLKPSCALSFYPTEL